jgi:AcrR family transcriptional regulator
VSVTLSETQTDVTEQILAAAFRCLAEKGSAQVSLRDIAREAGVALSQLHYYFGSREQLLARAAAFVMKRQITLLQAELQQAQSPADRVGLAIRYIRRHFRADPSLVKVHLDLQTMAAWSPELAAGIRELEEELLQVVLSESEHTGAAWLQTRTVARLVLGALDGLALQALHGAPPAEMDAAYAALESLLTSLIAQNENPRC